jgi:hypothetical protein
VPRLPPTLQGSVVNNHTFRFQTNADVVAYSVTVGNVIGAIGTIGTVVNTTVASIASSFKLKSITIWPAQSSAIHNAEFSWAGSYGTVADRSTTKSIPLGITETAPFRTRPGLDTLASDWQNSSTTSTVLGIMYDIPKGSIVDLSVTYTQRNTQAGVSYTVTTAALGTFYYLYLDGATAKFLPVALPTTI